MDILRNGRSIKVLSVLTYTFIMLILIIITKTPPASGYEISIYYAYPWYFWFLFIGANFSAILILLQEIFNDKKTNQWIPGFFAILTVNFIFFLLPFFRGYSFNGGAGSDIFSHMGWVKEIAQSGYISGNNFYPITHIFILSISDLLGVSVRAVTQFIPAIFWTLYSPFIFLIARSISKNNSQALLIASFSFPLMFSFFYLTVHPSFLSFIFLPLLLYLYHKRMHTQRKIELSLLIIILCFFIVFFHPMTTLIAIIIFLTFVVSVFIFRKGKSSLHRNTNRYSTAITLIFILAISFFTWYTSQESGLHAIKVIYQSLAYGSEWSIATNYLSTLSMANLTVLQTIRFFVLRYGTIIIYTVTAFLCLWIITKKFVFSRKIKELEVLYGMQLVAAFITAGAMIVGNFIVANPIRSMRYFLMITAILNGLVIYLMLEQSKKQKIKNNQKPKLLLPVGKYKFNFDKKRKIRFNKRIFLPSLITILLFFSSAICISNVYPSPIIWQPNNQFTHMNFAGSAWITESRDITIQTLQDVGVNLWRMEHYTNGIKMGNIRMKVESLPIPTHFGYDENNNTLLKVFNHTNMYMITTENARQAVNAFPKNIQPKVTQFTPNDLNKLNSDITVSKVYDNREVEVWWIYSN